MRLCFAPFPNSIAITYLCPPMIFALNCARSGHSAPDLPDHKIPISVWVEIPVGDSNDREAWATEAAAWIVEHCHDVDREIRAQLITPVLLN